MPDTFFSKMAKAVVLGGDPIAIGHTHEPWYREAEGVRFVDDASVS